MALSDGALHMFVRPIDRVEDQIFDAVRDAVEAGWTPKAFLQSVREAWAYKLDEDKKAAMEALRRATRS